MMTLILYNLLLLLLSPIALVYLIWAICFDEKCRRGFSERFGFIPRRKLPGPGPRVWVHGVSVGETMAARPIWEALLGQLPGRQLYYSTTTDTAQGEAQKMVGDRGTVIYFPFDFLPCVWWALTTVRPELIVLVETELWPNFLALAKLLGCKVLVVNGRISDRSLRGGKRAGWIYRWMTGNVDRFCMQSEGDAERIIRLGADPSRVYVVGNSKFDQVNGSVPPGQQVTMRHALGIARDEQVLVAGSTHPGEEEIVLRAFRQVKTAHPQARLILAPRNMHRGQEVEALVVAHGFAAVRRSHMSNTPPPPDAVIVLDTIGELAKLYALCTASFVGGSLVPIGGHNILEPLAFGRAPLFGPHMSNFRDIAALVLDGKAGMQIATAEELATEWSRFIDDPLLRRDIAKRSKIIIHQQQGASTRCAHHAADLLHLPTVKK